MSDEKDIKSIPIPVAVPKAEKVDKALEAPKVPKVKTIGYTYIGGGESPPMITKFMGKIDFMLGEVTEVPDTEENAMILQKLEGNPTFVKGKVDKKVVIDLQLAAQDKADTQRKEDKQTNARANRRNTGK